MLGTIVGIIVFTYLEKWCCSLYRIISDKEKLKTKAFRLICCIPQVQAYLNKEQENIKNECIKKYKNLRKDTAIVELPQDGVSRTYILDRIEKYNEESMKYYTNKGNVSGTVYTNDSQHWNFISEVMRKTIISNPLHFDEFMFIT